MIDFKKKAQESRIKQGKLCPYCLEKTQLVHSSEIYGQHPSFDYGMMYICRPCYASVGCHKGTEKAYGSLANSELKEWRKKAHAWFDPLWKRKLEQGISKKKARNAAYKWLSTAMKIDFKETHIAMFDIEQCQQVIEICKPYHVRK